MSTTDIRIAVGLASHPKTKKLVRRLGDGAAWRLVCLWLWAAANKPNGDLTGMSDEDIELAADWAGENDVFVATLVDLRLLDGDPRARRLHDWTDHNGWASGSGMRSAKAKWNAIKRHEGIHAANAKVPEWADHLRAIRAASNATSTVNEDSSNAKSEKPHAPSPSPSPSPSPRSKDPNPNGLGVVANRDDEPPAQAEAATKPIANGHPNAIVNGESNPIVTGDLIAPAATDVDEGATDAAHATRCPFQRIVALYHETLPTLPACEKLTKARAGHIRQRWIEDLQTLDDWRAFFADVAKSPFLMGRVEGRDGKPPFRANLEWLTKPSNYAKFIEGTYHRGLQTRNG